MAKGSRRGCRRGGWRGRVAHGCACRRRRRRWSKHAPALQQTPPCPWCPGPADSHEMRWARGWLRKQQHGSRVHRSDRAGVPDLANVDARLGCWARGRRSCPAEPRPPTGLRRGAQLSHGCAAPCGPVLLPMRALGGGPRSAVLPGVQRAAPAGDLRRAVLRRPRRRVTCVPEDDTRRVRFARTMRMLGPCTS